MPFKKTAQAVMTEPLLKSSDWEKMYGDRAFRSCALDGDHPFCKTASLKTAADSSKYLLSHCTIMASVQTEEEPFDYLIKPETSHLVNNNDDAWTNEVLKLSHRSFVGAFNFVEHFQNSKYAKGHILDAVLRKINIAEGGQIWVYFCDILVATDVTHEKLVDDIRSGRVRYLSMGCVTDLVICSYCGGHVTDANTYCNHLSFQKGTFLADDDGIPRRIAELCFPSPTRIVMQDGSRKAIKDVREGDRIITHTGKIQTVTKKYVRPFSGDLTVLDIQGLPQKLASTPKHPYWVMTPRDKCTCGCGQALPPKYVFGRKEYGRAFLQGHNLSLAAAVAPAVVPTVVPKFEFKEAQCIKQGDIVALPIPSETFTPSDTDETRAEILGWFLAEGSYLKYKKDRVGVSFTLNDKDEQQYALRIKTALETAFPPEFWTGSKRRTKSARVHSYPRPEGGRKLVVCYSNKAASRWLYRHASEYAGHKKLSAGVLLWDQKLQRIMLAAYVHGDGTVDSFARHSASSVSETLISQMQLVSARCGVWSRRQVIFDGKAVQLEEVVGKDQLRDNSNFRPLHTLHFQPCEETTGIFQMTEQKERGIGQKWRKQDNCMLYHVTGVGQKFYEGDVHNIEVEGDNSYLVEGIAVHNCGHKTMPNGGVKFVEASWVATPAFPGAAKRNIVAEEWVGPRTRFTESASKSASFAKAASKGVSSELSDTLLDADFRGGSRR
jgi:hypothetical protein